MKEMETSPMMVMLVWNLDGSSRFWSRLDVDRWFRRQGGNVSGCLVEQRPPTLLCGPSMASSSCSFWWRRIKGILSNVNQLFGAFHVTCRSSAFQCLYYRKKGRVKTCNPTLTIIPWWWPALKGVSSEPGFLDSLGFAFRYFPTGIQSVFSPNPSLFPRCFTLAGGGENSSWKISWKFHVGELIAVETNPSTPASKIFWDPPLSIIFV